MVFEIYKKFRNRIKQLGLLDTLYIIWVKSIFNQFDIPLPSDFTILHKSGINTKPTKLEIMLYNGLDHELDIILIETLYSASEVPTKGRTLKDPNVLSKALKEIREINDYISTQIKPKNDVFRSLHRIAHQQFFWQNKVNSHSLFPYFFVYNDPNMARIVKEKIGLSPYEIFIIGIYYTFLFQKYFAISDHQISQLKIIQTEKLEKFIHEFSIDIDQLRIDIKRNLRVDEKIFFTFNPLRATPIIKSKKQYVSPMPVLIYWAITKGLYYKINNHKSFSKSYGSAFQALIGKIMERAIFNEKLNISPEFEYYVGKERKDSVDWILKDNDEILFIECKTKRMTRSAQFSFTKEEMDYDRNKMIGFILQAYKSYLDYEHNNYINHQFSKKIKPRILILTLEDWFIELNQTESGILKDTIQAKLNENKIDGSLMEKVPYYIKSTSRFISDIQIINAVGLKKYFELREKNALQEFEDKFIYNNLFEKDFIEIFLNPITKNRDESIDLSP
jgi:hypothetical protein